MKLYCFPASPNSRKVQAVAYHLGVPLELHVVDLNAGGQKRRDYLKLNPNGLTPTLVDGDFVLWESNAIMQYIAAKKGSNSLWPADYKTRANIMRWQFWDVAHWGPAVGILIRENMLKKMYGLGAPDADEIIKGEDMFHRFASVLNDHLERCDYLVGDDITLAEFAIAAPLEYAKPARLPLAPYSKIRRWYARMEKLEAWQKTAPPKP